MCSFLPLLGAGEKKTSINIGKEKDLQKETFLTLRIK